MNQTLLIAVLALVLAFQKADPQDTQRAAQLNDERERLRREVDPSAVDTFDAVMLNAAEQHPDSAEYGDEPEIGENPLGLAPGPLELRRREQELARASRPPQPAEPAKPEQPAETGEGGEKGEGEQKPQDPK